jgi:HK97 family phage prohead protease
MKAVSIRDLPGSFQANRTDLVDGTEFKALSGVEFKVDRAKRRIEGWAARYGNIDLGDDRIHPGAATKTLKDRLPRGLIKFFFNHEFGIGMPETIEEHESGLLAVGRVTDHPDFDKYLALIEEGVLAHQSIGYTAIKVGFSEDEDTGNQIRDIFEFKLFEWGPVYWPMNELAEITAVKAAHAMVGIESVGASIRALQKAHAVIRSGTLGDRHERNLSALLDELTGVAAEMQEALDAAKGEPGSIGITTPGIEPPVEKMNDVVSALRHLDQAVVRLFPVTDS